jgi:hypothetical protein
MRREDIDRILAGEDTIVPSSGFAASVMEVVTREASAPPPIPFPWKRALPGLVLCSGAIIAFFVIGFASGGRSQPTPAALDLSPALSGAAWIAAAMLVSLVSVIFSMRVVGRRI